MCTEECGRLEAPDERRLVEAFDIVVSDVFAFLGPEHRLRPSPLAVFNIPDSVREPIDPTDVEYPFLVVQEYTGPNPPVRVTYGGRAYRLDLEIGANSSGYHSLGSWLEALEIIRTETDDSGLSTPTALAKHARRLARVLRDQFEAIRAAGPEVVATLSRATAPLHQTRETADDAFTHGDYATYIRLLEPLQDSLSTTERRKLEFAQQKVG